MATSLREDGQVILAKVLSHFVREKTFKSGSILGKRYRYALFIRDAASGFYRSYDFVKVTMLMNALIFIHSLEQNRSRRLFSSFFQSIHAEEEGKPET